MTEPTIDRIRAYAYGSPPLQHPWDGDMAGGARRRLPSSA